MAAPERVFLFTGTDSFLMEEEIGKKRASLGENALMNFYLFNSDESGAVDQALDLLNTIPFFDDERVVVIRNINKLDAKSFDKITSYAKNPSDTACLILTMDEPEEKSKKAPWKTKVDAFKGIAKIVLFSQMNNQQVLSWITNRAKSLNNDIDPDAANLLREATLSQTWQIASELEKLSLYAGKGNRITREHIGKLVLKTYDDTLFSLMDCVFDRKKDAIFKIKEIEASGVNELELIAALQNQAVGHFHVFFAPLAKRKNLHSFAESKMQPRRKLWKADELNSLIGSLAAVERGIKTGRSIHPFAEITEIAARYTLKNI